MLKNLKSYFILELQRRKSQICWLIIMMTHEFGHALGLAHPFERDPTNEMSQFRDKFVLQLDSQSFSRVPIMIPNGTEYFFHLRSTLERGILSQDMALSRQRPGAFAHQRRAAVDQARIELDQRGAGRKLGLGIGAGKNTAYADDGNRVAEFGAQFAYHPVGCIEDRHAG